MVFTRKTDAALASLVKQLDKLVAKHEEQQLRVFVNLIGEDREALEAEAKKFGAKHKVANVPIVVPVEHENGPDNFGINPDAAVTVTLYSGLKVNSSHAFDKFKKDDAKTVLADVPALLEESAAASDEAQTDEANFHASDHYGRLDFSPDGARLAVGGPTGQIHVWNLKEKKFVRVLRRSDERMLEDVAWNPQGTRLAAVDIWGRLSIHDAASGKELHFLSARRREEAIGSKERLVASLAWNLAGDSMVLTTANGFAVWNPDVPAESEAAVPDTDDDRFSAWHGTISADGRRLAQVDEYGKFRVWNLHTGEIALRSADFKGCQVYVAWSPDDRRIALSSNSTLRIVDARTGAIVRDVETPQQSSIVAWSPDSKILAVAQGWLNRWSSSDRPNKAISLVNSEDGTIRHRLNSGLMNIEALAWSTDGKTLASTGSSKVWRLDRNGDPQVVANPEMPVSLWDAENGRLFYQITPAEEP